MISFHFHRMLNFKKIFNSIFRINNASVRVNVTPNVECKLAKKSTSIRVQLANEAVPLFTKEGPNKLVLTWPNVPESTTTINKASSPVRAPLVAQMNRNNIANNGSYGNENGNGHYNNGNHEPPRNGNGYNNNRQLGIAKHAIVKPNGRAPPPPIPNRVESAY